MGRTRIDELSVSISADTSGLRGDLNRAQSDINGFKKSVDRSSADLIGARSLSRDISAHRKAAKESSLAWRAAGGTAKAALTGVVAGGVMLGGMAAMEAAVRGVSEAFQQAKESINLAAEAEQTRIAFEVMLNSGEKATEMLSGLREYAASTPFNLAEVIGSGRMLVGFDTEAEKVIGTVRMLGDVSAGTGKELKELTYLYASLMSQDRPYLIDLKQFATAGIPISKELAKVMSQAKGERVGVDEIRGLVEDGKVGNSDFRKAFASMTGPGGLYHGLTARQGETFAGVREQLLDSIQQLKTKFGQVLIDQLGLKQGAKDLSEFVSALEGHLPKIERGVKFMGDLGRGAAQVGYEFSRAAVAITSMQFDGLSKTSPQFKQLVDDARALVESLKDFKFDEVKIARFGLALFDAIGRPLAETADWAQVQGKAYADAFKKNFIDPVNEYLEVVRELRRVAGVAVDFHHSQVPKFGFTPQLQAEYDEQKANRAFFRDRGVAVPGEKAFDQGMLRDAVQAAKAAQDLAMFNPPRADEPERDAVTRFNHLEAMYQKSRWLSEVSGWKQFQPMTDALGKQRGEALRPFSEDPGTDIDKLLKYFREGKLPPRRANWVDIPPPAVSKTHTQTFDERKKLFGDSVMGAALQMKAEREAADEQKRIANELKTAFFGLGAAALSVAQNLKEIKMEAPEWELPIGVREAAKNARNNFKDPVKEFIEEWNNLSQALLEGEVGLDVYHLASADLIRKASQKAGLGGEYKLPDAAAAGSAESVRMLNQWQAGNQNSGVENLLQQMTDLFRQQVEISREINRKTNVPLIIELSK